jgi:hypothetical protein
MDRSGGNLKMNNHFGEGGLSMLANLNSTPLQKFVVYHKQARAQRPVVFTPGRLCFFVLATAEPKVIINHKDARGAQGAQRKTQKNRAWWSLCLPGVLVVM